MQGWGKCREHSKAPGPSGGAIYLGRRTGRQWGERQGFRGRKDREVYEESESCGAGSVWKEKLSTEDRETVGRKTSLEEQNM